MKFKSAIRMRVTVLGFLTAALPCEMVGWRGLLLEGEGVSCGLYEVGCMHMGGKRQR